MDGVKWIPFSNKFINFLSEDMFGLQVCLKKDASGKAVNRLGIIIKDARNNRPYSPSSSVYVTFGTERDYVAIEFLDIEADKVKDILIGKYRSDDGKNRGLRIIIEETFKIKLTKEGTVE